MEPGFVYASWDLATDCHEQYLKLGELMEQSSSAEGVYSCDPAEVHESRGYMQALPNPMG